MVIQDKKVHFLDLVSIATSNSKHSAANTSQADKFESQS